MELSPIRGLDMEFTDEKTPDIDKIFHFHSFYLTCYLENY